MKSRRTKQSNRSARGVAKTRWLVIATVALGCGSSESGTDQPDSERVNAATSGADAAAVDAAGAGTDAGFASGPAEASVPFRVPENSPLCADLTLPLRPPGCFCTPGDEVACWTGPANMRNVGKCRDGHQVCSGEFTEWSECTGSVTDCGELPPPPDPPCQCVPGTVVGCDEDCSAQVFCAPFSTKECMPDGKFAPCREQLLGGAGLGGCMNVFFGCFAENPEGIYTGDCSKAFTCGHPPDAAMNASP